MVNVTASNSHEVNHADYYPRKYFERQPDAKVGGRSH